MDAPPISHVQQPRLARRRRHQPRRFRRQPPPRPRPRRSNPRWLRLEGHDYTGDRRGHRPRLVVPQRHATSRWFLWHECLLRQRRRDKLGGAGLYGGVAINRTEEALYGRAREGGVAVHPEHGEPRRQHAGFSAQSSRDAARSHVRPRLRHAVSRRNVRDGSRAGAARGSRSKAAPRRRFDPLQPNG